MRFIKLLATASVIGSPVRTPAEEQPRAWGLVASAADWVARAPDQIEKIEAPFAMPPLDRPVFRDQVFNIADYGAQGDGITKNTEAFRKAIAACSAAGGGKVLVPTGKWLTGAIHMKSNINLHMEAGAEIHFSDDPADYLPVVFQRWAGLEVMNYSPLIYALDCENIAVTGPGRLFGHGRRWQSWFKSEQSSSGSMLRIYHDLVLKNIPVEQRVFGTEGGAFGDPRHPGLRPSFIQPVRCRNVLLEGFTIQGYGPFWTIHPTYCENVIIRGVRVHTQGGHNADGIDLDSTRNVLVEYCYLDTGDDAIVVHTGTNAEGRRIGMPTENVVVRHIMVLGGHGGMVIGSLTSGGVRSILVHDCTYDGTQRGIRLKSNKSRGGVVENLWYRDITMRGIKDEAIVIETDYKAALPAGADQADYPTFRNITIENVTCHGAPVAASLIGTDEAPIENLVMKNVSVQAAKGMHFRSVRGLNLINVNVKVSDGIPMTFTNCEEVQ